ncbi:MAG: ABC transporter permease [Brevinematales bacterium]|nr:ABC transporter permease [Brevinematales bacterium]
MLKYILKRILISIPTLLGITLITFFIMRLAPGDPVQAMSGGMATKYSKAAHDKFMAYYGFDKPLIVQYGIWVGKMVVLDFGDSLMEKRPVMEIVAEKIPVTLYLNIMEIIVIFLISIPIGIRSAVKRDGLFDKSTGVLFFVLYSLFVPWVAIFLISIFSIKLNLLPLSGIVSEDFDYLPFFGKIWDVVRHSILPVTVMSYSGLAFLTRITRGSILEVLGQEYIITAKSKGLPRSMVMRKHAFSNALIPLITIFGAILPTLISGSVIVEEIFQIDGMGRLFFRAVTSRDWFVIMGLTTISAVLTLIGLLLSDIMYAIVDPRIKYE